MKQYGLRYIALILTVLFICGCGQKNLETLRESHKAVQMYRDGIWKPRYTSSSSAVGGNGIQETNAILSINVYKNMEKDDMMEVLDYYKLTYNADFNEEGEYRGELDTDYTCYATFYKEDTDEELVRIKCLNGEEVAPAQEDDSIFPLPSYHTEEGDRGEGALP